MFSMHVQTAAMDIVFVEVVIPLQAKRCGKQKRCKQQQSCTIVRTRVRRVAVFA